MICSNCNQEFNPLECGVNSYICRHCLLSTLSTDPCNGNKKRFCDLWNCKKCFEWSFASVEKCRYWDYVKNIDWPIDVRAGASAKFWFNCPCGHSFDQSLSNTILGKWCPFCAKIPKRLCINDCTKCYDRSFASSEYAHMWSSRNDLTARQVFLKSNAKFWFSCSTCNHDFKVVVSDMEGCPYCVGSRICGLPDCSMCFDRSVASLQCAPYWSIENNMSMYLVSRHSNNKYKFDCSCGHRVSISPNTITQQVSWCGYCSGKRLCGKCETCRLKSFDTHPRSQNWHECNIMKPYDVFRRALKKYWFRCDDGHEFDASPDSISAGKWCPFCRNKTEAIIAEFFSDVTFESQPRFDWCRNINCLPFDFLVDKTLVECDGGQHFKDVALFRSTAEEVRTRDVQKMKLARDNGYRIIRISQPCIWHSRFDWRAELSRALASNEPVMYLASDVSIYDAHKLDLKNMQDIE